MAISRVLGDRICCPLCQSGLQDGAVEGSDECGAGDVGLGLADGEVAKVTSSQGEISVPVAISLEMPPGVVFLPDHFAQPAALQVQGESERTAQQRHDADGSQYGHRAGDGLCAAFDDRQRSRIGLLAALQQANIVPVHTAGDTNGLPYYTMPFVEGESLRARLDREKQLPVDEAVRIAVAIAGELAPEVPASVRELFLVGIGAQPGAYSRVHSLAASGSPRIWPLAGSVFRLRPTRWAMLPS